LEKVTSVSQLKRLLDERGLSPRDLAEQLGVSHMTIYRWLAKPGHFSIPKKYHLSIDQFVSGGDVAQAPTIGAPWYQDRSILDQLSSDGGPDERAGQQLIRLLECDGKECDDHAKLKADVNVKLQAKGITTGLREKVRDLMKGLFSSEMPARSKLVIAGALLYFLSPIDLIPDTIPVLGYVDDLAVLTLAADFVSRNQRKDSKKTSDSARV
jgi:uncharacterized membrane protein YkvA (DUF1232 family)